jgi:hypothetical protein
MTYFVCFKKTNGGMIAGIVVGVVAFVALVPLVAFVVYKVYTKNSKCFLS